MKHMRPYWTSGVRQLVLPEVLIVVAVLPGLVALFSAGLLRQYQKRVFLAIAAIVLGVVCTQLIHLVCVPGRVEKKSRMGCRSNGLSQNLDVNTRGEIVCHASCDSFGE